MSVHSAISHENNNLAHSNHNNPDPSLQAHSVMLQTSNLQHQEWVAAFIDGQYYLTDPESMKKLRDIEAEIEREKLRLEKFNDQNSSMSNSFLSLQAERNEKQSNRSFCNTQFNADKHQYKQEKVKNELENEEDKYREKIKKVEKQRNQRKNKLETTDKKQIESCEVPLEKGEAKEGHKEDKISVKKEEAIEVEKSRKSGRRSLRADSKDKSYHKSRIQQSIKANNQIQGEEIPENKSIKAEELLKNGKNQNNSVKKSANQQQKNSVKVSEKSKIVGNDGGLQQSDYQIQVNAVGSIHSSRIQPLGLTQEQKIAQSRIQENGSPSVKSKVSKKQEQTEKKSIKRQNSIKDKQKEVESRSSHHNEDIKIQKNMSQLNEDVFKETQSKMSSVNNIKEQIRSKHSSRVSKPDQSEKRQSRVRSIKKDSRVQQDNMSRKSDAFKKKKEEEQRGKGVDKSVQYSRVTENKETHVNEIKFQNSEKNNSIIQQQQSLMNESSNYEIINQQLPQQTVQNLQTSEQYNMKRKDGLAVVNENQSQKKSRSFIIHSRNGSVKQRSQKSYDKFKKSKLSEKKSQKDVMALSSFRESVSKEDFIKFHQEIQFLRQKLRKVEERQMEIERIEQNSSHSKVRSRHSVQQIEKNKDEIKQETPDPSLNALNRLNELSFGVRSPAKLNLQSSTIHVNTAEQALKKKEKDKQADEKVHLVEQISRLKKIIRDMQIQKIKSIDIDNDVSPLIKKHSKQISQRGSRVSRDKDSEHEQQPISKKLWSKSRVDDVGRIIKNSFGDDGKQEFSPRRRSQLIKIYGAEEVVMPDDLPQQSSQRSPLKLLRGAKHSSMIEKLHQKEKDFHSFMQSSRMLVQQQSKRQEQQVKPNSFQSFRQSVQSTSLDPTAKINYSRMVEEFKKANPEQQQILPEVNLRDIQIPEIPHTPNSEMNQEELLDLAKKTYKVFNIDVDTEDKQLCVKKYKNCIVFSITNNTSQCILWHFSGKFYMGGWKSGLPGEGEKNGEGIEIVPEKYVYKGQFLNGKKNGTGILKLMNGNIYDGQWVEGQKNGHGVYFDSATRVVFSGEWKDGKKDGQGYLKLSDKQYYYGTFSKSVKEGFGTELFINGDKYKGQYKNGKFHGKGKYTWQNGSCFEGQFVEGVRQGQGSWKSAKVNGDIYIGTYEADKKNGYGRYVWANGCTYEGGFANDVKHGKGRLTYQDGKQVKGVWSEGNLIRTQNERILVDNEQQPLRRSTKVNSFGYNPATRIRL